MTDTRTRHDSPYTLARLPHAWEPEAESGDLRLVRHVSAGAHRVQRCAALGHVLSKLPDPSNRRVLIVDDDQGIHDDFAEMLQPRGWGTSDDLAATFLGRMQRRDDLLPAFELLHARSGEQAYELVRRGRESGRPVAVAYVDVRMPPGMDGVETIRRIRAVDAEVEFVIMTAYTDKPLSEIISDMELLHKLLYIRKPFAREEIQQITLSLVEKWNVERELAEKRRQLVSSHRRLATVLDATGDAIAMYDVNERLVFANYWYEELVGASETELQRMEPQEVAEHVRQRFREPRLADHERELFSAGDASVVEPVDAPAVSERRLLHRSKTVVRDDQEVMIGDLYVYRDMSKAIEAHRMEAEVLRLRTELATASA